MTASGETADQMTRMTLQGIEVAANVALKAGGMASKSLAAMLYAILTDKKKVKGKARLNSMLKSGKELKVFAIHHNDLKVFCQEAKRYGVMYCVLKEKKPQATQTTPASTTANRARERTGTRRAIGITS